MGHIKYICEEGRQENPGLGNEVQLPSEPKMVINFASITITISGMP
jgi:hypothetical protein